MPPRDTCSASIEDVTNQPRSSRSYEAYEPGQPLYRVIEFCREPKALWDKIESGHWQWLGIRPDGMFVLGRPPRHGLDAQVAGTAAEEGTDPASRIEFRAPRHGMSARQFSSPEAARAAFGAFIAAEGPDGMKGPGIWRVRLITDGHLEDEQLVVRKRTNYL